MLGPGGPPRFGGPPLLGPGGPPRLGGPPLLVSNGPVELDTLPAVSSSSSKIAPQCGHFLSESLTRPSQISQANISSPESVFSSLPLSSLILSIVPSLERNRFTSTTASSPFSATSVEIACSNAEDRLSGVSRTLPSST